MIHTPPRVTSMPRAQLIQLADYSSIAFAQVGSGEPIVLVHGALCDYRYWEPQFIPLASKNCVLSLSLSHYFPTRDLNHSFTFNWNTHVQQIVQFIDIVAREPVHIVAHSRGAYLAFHLAHRFPGRLRSMTLIDPIGFTKNGEILDCYASLCQMNTLHTRAAGLINKGEVDAGLALFVDSVSCQGTWAQSPDKFKTIVRDNAHTLWLQIIDQIPDFSAHEASEITLPIMLVVGEKSPSIFHQNIECLRKHVKGASQITMAGVSHGMNLADPHTFNRLVLNFIRENSQT
ncbi:alpha/beta fold hydrolase [Candidatus Vallotiella sp. (ex Adelges kitamiensis)]|uniref:alpha/beta fold hydrolase n=1 Tax=Candidatus Vallotiella sp. (ex Adelges kitamiensis) TaxID=2864217 RepID=UPI001CE25948|nr:alpha/beta hydrolase [Candidatus Vallotia sp. (ex Adelges kitamiensis)]